MTVIQHVRKPDRPPPISQTGAIAWIRENFFGTVSNSILTLIGLYLLYLIIPAVVNWAVIEATISGTDRTGCDANRDGACWTFIKVRFNQIIFGLFYSANTEEIWRPVLVFGIFAGLIATLVFGFTNKLRDTITLMLIVAPFYLFSFTTGGLEFILNSFSQFAIGVISFNVDKALFWQTLLSLATLAGISLPLIFPFATNKQFNMLLAGLLFPFIAFALLICFLLVFGFVVAIIEWLASYWWLSKQAFDLLAYPFEQINLGPILPYILGPIIILLVVFGAMNASSLVQSTNKKLYLGLLTLFILPFIAFAFIHGGWFGLSVAESDQWGGLMLTVMLAFIGIAAAFPIGILMALGRQSDMPIVRFLCVLYIELWRAAPLITILFMASVMLPLFFPAELDFDKVLRAMIGISLFQSAYTAEAIRGGLQAIPKGQYEAADALGLSYWRKTGLIILPQALKIAIPGIVNTFITLFKDTSLVSIIALAELTGITRFAAGSLEWKGKLIEGYVFAAFVYWCFCFSMSRYAGNLERKLDTSHRN